MRVPTRLAEALAEVNGREGSLVDPFNSTIPDTCKPKAVTEALQEFARRNKLPRQVERIFSTEELDNLRIRNWSLGLRCSHRFTERYSMLRMYHRIITRPLTLQNTVLQYCALFEYAQLRTSRISLRWRTNKTYEELKEKMEQLRYRTKPMIKAYMSGAGLIFVTKDMLYWSRHIKVNYDPEGRMHGTASCLGQKLPIWHGVVLPNQYLNPDAIEPRTALLIANAEVRRSACEMLGWEKILSTLDPVVIDNQCDPQIGTLVEVHMPTGRNSTREERARFLMVKCGTGRNFSIRVPPNTATVNAAQRAIFGLTKFVPPEVRT